MSRPAPLDARLTRLGPARATAGGAAALVALAMLAGPACRPLECLRDADCPSPTPICDAGTCMECSDDFDCQDKDGLTYFCWRDEHDFGICAQCLWSANQRGPECPSTRPFCWRESDADLSQYDPYVTDPWQDDTHVPRCVECLVDTDCPGYSSGDRCYLTVHTCD